ncbi:MAG TPA: GDSL-type esterase/lipase family protein [Vicinamibacterales bacterium]|nr:GDSL-type esterase/lipase family protein [Vicinamibacterales bacterium]HPW20507.1 GDSL-type esterase/lipase family protein [Vicinamibacterales bacterium]
MTDRSRISWRTLAVVSAFVAALALASAGCGDKTTVLTAPSPQLAIACPDSQTAMAPSGQPVAVSWPAPATSGGTAPVRTTCTPSSGSSFGLGSTTVACSATGAARGETASCTFTVTVHPSRLSVTTFMAYGDSITWGKKSDPVAFVSDMEPENDYSYPNVLRRLLAAGYPGQQFTVLNEGKPGEAVAAGLSRLPGELALGAPDVLLLLDGANDLLGSPGSATTEYIAGQLRQMVRTAKALRPGIAVLLANFPPQWHGSVPYDRGAGAEFVPELNQRIASLAAAEGATLVDLYGPLSADIKRYIGADGLHPTEAGFALMAETFYAAIRRTFETTTAGRR